MTYIEYICDIIKRQANRVPIYTKHIAENVAEDYNLSEKEAAAAVSVAIKRIIDNHIIPELRFYQKGIYYKTVITPFGEAGIKKEISPRMLRHSFATHLLENGAGIKDIKDMLGHSGISSTQVYTQIVKEMHESSYKRFHPKAGL